MWSPVRDPQALRSKRFEDVEDLPKGLAKPGISESPPSTLLELALPLDEEGRRAAPLGIHSKKSQETS